MLNSWDVQLMVGRNTATLDFPSRTQTSAACDIES